MDVSIAREMVQARLLSGLFSQSLRNDLVLKGGMALRAANVSERYTKDIDLSAFETVSKERVEGSVRKAIATLRSSGLLKNMEVSEPKQTDTTLRWKIGGVVEKTEINLTVEVSRRPGLPAEHVRTVNWAPPREYGLPPIMIDSLDLEAMALTKFSCLGDPKREAPRDVYDLHVLVMMEIKPPMEMLRKLGPEVLESYRANVWAKLEKMSFEQAKTHLYPFLPEGARSRLDRDTWESMRLRVGERIDDWVAEATSGAEAMKPT